MPLRTHSIFSQPSARQPAVRLLARSHLRRCSPAPAVPGPDLLEAALLEARANNFEEARSHFSEYTETHPEACKVYVSWAQMEKRMPDDCALSRCRAVLQEGLRINPTSACLIQAWGLLELQRGNLLAALMMLERAVKIEPRCSPVLRWHQVSTARRTIGSLGRRVLPPTH